MVVMIRILSALLLLVPVVVFAQPLTSINFKDWYNPDNEVQLSFNMIKNSNRIETHYRLQSKQPLDQYSVVWEKRDSFTQREGVSISPDTVMSMTDNELRGSFDFEIPAKSWLLVAKVTQTVTKTSWVYVQLIDPIWPVIGWLQNGQGQSAEKYMTIQKPYTVNCTSSDQLFVSYFNSDFQAATPPFSDRQVKADRFIFYDSTFTVKTGEPFIPRKLGLYLFQKDTNAAEGFAFRCTDEIYPKFSKIADLVDPLIYITTPEEYSELVKANGDKAKFDKVILDITRDKDRAKTFMRNYFRRIELANQYFSSYKTGWKTDRGMIYTIFGIPDEVSINDGSESWNYDTFKVRFTFVKSGSVYDPNNYVLLRDKRFTETWFSNIDLWRKSRF